MTLTPFTVYLIMQADAVCTVLGILASIAAIALVWITGAVFCDRAASNEECMKLFRALKLRRWWLLWVCLLLPVAVAMPNTKTLATMFVIPAIANSPAIQKDFPELYDLAIGKLKEQLKPAGVEK